MNRTEIKSKLFLNKNILQILDLRMVLLLSKMNSEERYINSVNVVMNSFNEKAFPIVRRGYLNNKLCKNDSQKNVVWLLISSNEKTDGFDWHEALFEQAKNSIKEKDNVICIGQKAKDFCVQNKYNVIGFLDDNLAVINNRNEIALKVTKIVINNFLEEEFTDFNILYLNSNHSFVQKILPLNTGLLENTSKVLNLNEITRILPDSNNGLITIVEKILTFQIISAISNSIFFSQKALYQKLNESKISVENLTHTLSKKMLLLTNSKNSDEQAIGINYRKVTNR